MEEQFLTLTSVEIDFPLHFLTQSIVFAQNDVHSNVEWDVAQVGANKNKLYTCLSDNNLRLKFDQLTFSIQNGSHKCKFDTVLLEMGQNHIHTSSENDQICENSMAPDPKISENQKQMQAILSIQPQSVNTVRKRKVGRPRKIQKLKPAVQIHDSIENKSHTDQTCMIGNSVELNSDVKTDCEDADPITENNVKSAETEDISVPEKRKRYSLRGVKLNADIMGAVKGINCYGEIKQENDVEETSEIVNQEDLINLDVADDPDFNIKENVHNNIQERLYPKKENNESISSSLSNMKQFLGGLPKTQRRQRKVSNIRCKICKRKLADYTGVYEHVQKKHSRRKDCAEYLEELKGLKIEKCVICELTFSDRRKLNMHEDREHSRTGRVKCSKCGKSFKNLPTLRTHINWMHLQEPGVKNGVCHLCTATFKSATTLKQHIDRVHMGNRHVQCDICEKKFYNKSQLRRHSRIHNTAESQKHECETCGKRFVFAHNLKTHMDVVHTDHKESFHCPYCGKGFGRKTGMVSHIQLVHFNIFPYSCKLCKATFPRAVVLKEHMISYHKQVDFQVTKKLVKHGIYNKTAEDMFYCSYCRDSFLHKTKLIEHMHSDHSDAFPYKCEDCNQGFLERSYIVMHKVKAHGILMTDLPEEESENASGKKHQILQIISAKQGHPNKILQVGSSENSEQMTIEEQSTILQQSQDEEVLETGTSGSSLLIEVASGNNTCRYVIEAPEILGESGSVTVAQDIANLLLAAEQSLQEGAEVTTTGDGATEISLVIDGQQPEYVADGYVTEATTGAGGEVYTGEVPLGVGNPSNVQIQIQDTDSEINSLHSSGDFVITYANSLDTDET